MLLGREKVSFLQLPTPLTHLDTLSQELGINLYLKRDDLTELGTGGNKLRKLEYLLQEAREQGATMLLTTGGAQTNHGRLTAAVAARYGLKCAIVAVDPYPGEISANLILDGIMGCPVYLKQNDGRPESQQAADAIAQVREEWEAKGEKVYFIPVGGSNPVGSLGYYECALELSDQIKAMGLDDPRLVTTLGSCGTYTGLAAAQLNENLPFRLTGVSISPKPEGGKAFAAEKYAEMAQAFHLSATPSPDDFDVTDAYHCGAYNNPVSEVRQAIYHMGRSEGIILDPCYTGKTFRGLCDMVETGQIRKGETVIMLHTGGIPGIYTRHHREPMEQELEGYIRII